MLKPLNLKPGTQPQPLETAAAICDGGIGTGSNLSLVMVPRVETQHAERALPLIEKIDAYRDVDVVQLRTMLVERDSALEKLQAETRLLRTDVSSETSGNRP